MAVNTIEPEGGKVFTILLSLVSMGALSVCLSRRLQVRKWSALPINCWVILAIYIESMIFVMGTAVISNAYNVNTSQSLCAKGLILCLSCYMTTKLLIYFFLVERAYIIRRSKLPRMKDRLYLFNSFGMLVPYAAVIALNFIFRFARIDDGICSIGMRRFAMLPLIAFDILVNVYLTTLFLIPLRRLYSYKNTPNSQARTIAIRTFIGSCCTLTFSVANLSVVMALQGEPGWICLMCCNIDVLFSVLVLHWCTSKDNAGTLNHNNHNSLTLNLDPNHPYLLPQQNTTTITTTTTTTTKKDTPLHPLTKTRTRPLIPRSATAEYSLKERAYEAKSQVTTFVTAQKGQEEEIELERILTFPRNVAVVQKRLGERMRAGSDGSGSGSRMRGSGQDRRCSDMEKKDSIEEIFSGTGV